MDARQKGDRRRPAIPNLDPGLAHRLLIMSNLVGRVKETRRPPGRVKNCNRVLVSFDWLSKINVAIFLFNLAGVKKLSIPLNADDINKAIRRSLSRDVDMVEIKKKTVDRLSTHSEVTETVKPNENSSKVVMFVNGIMDLILFI